MLVLSSVVFYFFLATAAARKLIHRAFLHSRIWFNPKMPSHFHFRAPPAPMLKISVMWQIGLCSSMDVNQTIICSSRESLKSIGPCLLGHVDMWTWPSFGGGSERKFYFFLFHDHFSQATNYRKLKFFHNMLCEWQWATPKNLGLLEKI